MIAVKINLTIKMIYLQLKTTIMHYKNLSKQISWHSNRQRETATIIRHLSSAADHAMTQGNRFCTLKYFFR